MARKSGKYQKRSKGIPFFGWILLAVLILSLSAGSVVAWLSLSGDHVSNSLTRDADQNPVISEDFKNNIKKNVCVSVGDTGHAVYVRATILVNWKNERDGNVLAYAPVLGTDYTLDMNETDWFLKDGFYYHRALVNSQGSTETLINACQLKNGVIPPADYELNVEIIAQTIQALGTTDMENKPAAEAAWGITVDTENKILAP